jgi:hypothetical protein
LDLPVVEKPVPAILMNCDNQTVITKVNSAKDDTKSTRHVKRRLKSIRKLRNSGVLAVAYVQTDKNLADPFTIKAITECDRICIKGDGYETHVSLQ